MSSNRPNPTFVVRRTGQDELQHWKYVKKEKVNGKWKYYYSWDELKKDAKNALGVNAKQNMNAVKNVYNQTRKDADAARANAVKAQKKAEGVAYKKSLAGWATNNKAKKASAFASEAAKISAAKGREYLNAKAEYMKTPLGKLDQAKADVRSGYSKAKRSVSKFFESLPGKAKKTAENVEAKVGSTVKRATKKVKKEVNEFANNVERTAKNAYNRAEYEIRKRRRK